MRKWLGESYEVESWREHTEDLRIGPNQIRERIGELRFLDFDVAETWMEQTLPKAPRLPRRLNVHTTFRATADEIRAQPQLYANSLRMV